MKTSHQDIDILSSNLRARRMLNKNSAIIISENSKTVNLNHLVSSLRVKIILYPTWLTNSKSVQLLVFRQVFRRDSHFATMDFLPLLNLAKCFHLYSALVLLNFTTNRGTCVMAAELARSCGGMVQTVNEALLLEAANDFVRSLNYFRLVYLSFPFGVAKTFW